MGKAQARLSVWWLGILAGCSAVCQLEQRQAEGLEQGQAVGQGEWPEWKIPAPALRQDPGQYEEGAWNGSGHIGTACPTRCGAGHDASRPSVVREFRTKSGIESQTTAAREALASFSMGSVRAGSQIRVYEGANSIPPKHGESRGGLVYGGGCARC